MARARTSTSTRAARVTAATTANRTRSGIARTAASGIDRAWASPGSTTARPATPARNGSNAMTVLIAAYDTTQRRRRGGRSEDHGPRAVPVGSAGEPDQDWPFVTAPSTAEPGATSAYLPTTAPGPRVLRVPILAPAPTLTAPMWRTSPS